MAYRPKPLIYQRFHPTNKLPLRGASNKDELYHLQSLSGTSRNTRDTKRNANDPNAEQERKQWEEKTLKSIEKKIRAKFQDALARLVDGIVHERIQISKPQWETARMVVKKNSARSFPFCVNSCTTPRRSSFDRHLPEERSIVDVFLTK